MTKNDEGGVRKGRWELVFVCCFPKLVPATLQNQKHRHALRTGHSRSGGLLDLTWGRNAQIPPGENQELCPDTIPSSFLTYLLLGTDTSFMQALHFHPHHSLCPGGHPLWNNCLCHPAYPDLTLVQQINRKECSEDSSYFRKLPLAALTLRNSSLQPLLRN
jgi:hypothetical protein